MGKIHVFFICRCILTRNVLALQMCTVDRERGAGGTGAHTLGHLSATVGNSTTTTAYVL
jgi:hypothetical protein